METKYYSIHDFEVSILKIRHVLVPSVKTFNILCRLILKPRM